MMIELTDTLLLCGFSTFQVVFSLFSIYVVVDSFQSLKGNDVNIRTIFVILLTFLLLSFFITAMFIAVPVALTSFIKIFAITWNLI